MGLSALIHDLAPRNAELLETRATLQSAIDRYHRERAAQAHDADDYRAFLEEIGYLVPSGPAFEIDTAGCDPEITTVAGPQLVVPITNARYAINAANARWGSLYDALYGTDALGDLPAPGPYDPDTWRACDRLGAGFPRRRGSDGADRRKGRARTATWSAIGSSTAHCWPPTPTAEKVASTTRPRSRATPENRVGRIPILFEHHGLGIEIVIDRAHPIGSTDAAGVADVVLESALTSIMDFEDSIAAVDSADKALAYHNWLGLMTGSLTEQVTKERQHVHPATRGRPHVHRTRRFVVHSPRHGADAGPQRRPPHDDASSAGSQMDRPCTRGCSMRWSPSCVRCPALGATRRDRTLEPVPCTSSSRRCTALPRWRSRTRSSAGSRRCWAFPPTP